MGKVHGGLTRAGKVRNQTKKIETPDIGKKKHSSGRARLRTKYNNRLDALNENKQHKFNPQN